MERWRRAVERRQLDSAGILPAVMDAGLMVKIGIGQTGNWCLPRMGPIWL